MVATLGGSDLPLLYRISAVWGGRAGPLLMWCGWMALGTFILTKTQDAQNLSLRLCVGFTGTLLSISILLDPFAPSSGFSGQLNPLLQTDLMVIHPPVIFAFYSLCIIPALISVAGSILGLDQATIHQRTLPWSRAAFVVGTAGIGLGGLWAYTVLDWGGYWAWDPVETASFLPWIGLVAVLHARSQSDKRALASSPSIVIAVGALAMHATLVTRANGVWASVHSFAADGVGSKSSDPYLRIVSLLGEGAAGVEVMTYLIITVLFGLAILRNLMKNQSAELSNQGRSSMRKTTPTLSIFLVTAVIIIGVLSGSVLLLSLSMGLMVLIIEGDGDDADPVWIFSGVALYLFASWSWMAPLSLSIMGMAVFLLPWVLSSPKDAEGIPIERLVNARSQNAFARSTPWFGAMGYLALTWMLLTAEIDGTSLEAHEVFGAPFVAALAIGLIFHSWGIRSNGKTGLFVVLGILLLSITSGLMSDKIALPGDADRYLTEELTRGQVSAFLLTLVIFSIPSSIGEMIRALRKSKTASASAPPFNRSNRGLRSVGSSIAHVGILLLLFGHVLTTTLVDRTDPSHLVTLVKDQPVEHEGYILTFTGLEILDSSDPGYGYSIADGLVRFHIDVADLEGEFIDEVSPSILRFDTPSGAIIPRSEVDRVTQLDGDLMFILDIQQANRVITNMMMGEIDEVDRVGVTVYDLKGSHMVWFGWILLLIGGSLPMLSKRKLFIGPTD